MLAASHWTYPTTSLLAPMQCVGMPKALGGLNQTSDTGFAALILTSGASSLEAVGQSASSSACSLVPSLFSGDRGSLENSAAGCLRAKAPPTALYADLHATPP